MPKDNDVNIKIPGFQKLGEIMLLANILPPSS